MQESFAVPSFSMCPSSLHRTGGWFLGSVQGYEWKPILYFTNRKRRRKMEKVSGRCDHASYSLIGDRGEDLARSDTSLVKLGCEWQSVAFIMPGTYRLIVAIAVTKSTSSVPLYSLPSILTHCIRTISCMLVVVIVSKLSFRSQGKQKLGCQNHNLCPLSKGQKGHDTR